MGLPATPLAPGVLETHHGPDRVGHGVVQVVVDDVLPRDRRQARRLRHVRLEARLAERRVDGVRDVATGVGVRPPVVAVAVVVPLHRHDLVAVGVAGGRAQLHGPARVRHPRRPPVHLGVRPLVLHVHPAVAEPLPRPCRVRAEEPALEGVALGEREPERAVAGLEPHQGGEPPLRLVIRGERGAALVGGVARVGVGDHLLLTVAVEVPVCLDHVELGLAVAVLDADVVEVGVEGDLLAGPDVGAVGQPGRVDAGAERRDLARVPPLHLPFGPEHVQHLHEDVGVVGDGIVLEQRERAALRADVAETRAAAPLVGVRLALAADAHVGHVVAHAAVAVGESHGVVAVAVGALRLGLRHPIRPVVHRAQSGAGGLGMAVAAVLLVETAAVEAELQPRVTQVDPPPVPPQIAQRAREVVQLGRALLHLGFQRHRTAHTDVAVLDAAERRELGDRPRPRHVVAVVLARAPAVHHHPDQRRLHPQPAVGVPALQAVHPFAPVPPLALVVHRPHPGLEVAPRVVRVGRGDSPRPGPGGVQLHVGAVTEVELDVVGAAAVGVEPRHLELERLARLSVGLEPGRARVRVEALAGLPAPQHRHGRHERQVAQVVVDPLADGPDQRPVDAVPVRRRGPRPQGTQDVVAAGPPVRGQQGHGHGGAHSEDRDDQPTDDPTGNRSPSPRVLFPTDEPAVGSPWLWTALVLGQTLRPVRHSQPPVIPPTPAGGRARPRYGAEVRWRLARLAGPASPRRPGSWSRPGRRSRHRHRAPRGTTRSRRQRAP